MAVLTVCHVLGDAGVISMHGKLLLLLLVCWCGVFHTIPRFVWIELNHQLVVADLSLHHEHLLLATATASA